MSSSGATPDLAAAQHLAKTFGIEVAKDVVRRVLAAHYRPERRDSGPSWLALLGHAKDSLWSLDLFRTDSILLRTPWVLVIMDQFSRRIIGFGVQAVAVDGVALCRMFNQAIYGQGLPIHLSLDHDPLFEFQRWQATNYPSSLHQRSPKGLACPPRKNLRT